MFWLFSGPPPVVPGLFASIHRYSLAVLGQYVC